MVKTISKSMRLSRVTGKGRIAHGSHNATTSATGVISVGTGLDTPVFAVGNLRSHVGGTISGTAQKHRIISFYKGTGTKAAFIVCSVSVSSIGAGYAAVNAKKAHFTWYAWED